MGNELPEDGGAPEGGSNEALEQEETGTRRASVEAEDKLVDVGLEMLGRDAAVVSREQDPFEQGEDAVNLWQAARGVSFGLDRRGRTGAKRDGGMIVPEAGEGRIAHPAVGPHVRPHFHVPRHEGGDRGRGRIGRDGEADAPAGFLKPRRECTK